MKTFILFYIFTPYSRKVAIKIEKLPLLLLLDAVHFRGKNKKKTSININDSNRKHSASRDRPHAVNDNVMQAHVLAAKG